MKPTEAPSDTAPKLSEFLCFAIYSTNLAFGKAYKPILESLGLTYTQYITIIALWEQDNQTVGQLGEKLFLESNTLTPILKKLEAMGSWSGTAIRRTNAGARQPDESGRRVREETDMNLVEATGLKPDEFAKMQKAIVTLRGNLIRSTDE